jgi:hypothetical protein
VAAFAQLAAMRCGIAAPLQADFGAACGLVLGGVLVQPAAQATCDIACALLAGSGFGPDSVLALAAEDSTSPAFAQAALPRLTRLAELHLDWSVEPARHAALMMAWRCGVTLELSGV